MAAALELLVTGGSDFHDPSLALRPGASALPAGDWQRLAARGRELRPVSS
jgi:hypothetical protein